MSINKNENISENEKSCDIDIDKLVFLDYNNFRYKSKTFGVGFFTMTNCSDFYKKRMLEKYCDNSTYTYNKNEIIKDTKMVSGIINIYFYKYVKIFEDLDNDAHIIEFSDKDSNQCILLLFNQDKYMNKNCKAMQSLYDLLNINTPIEVYKINQQKHAQRYTIYYNIKGYKYAIIIRNSTKKIISNTKSAAKR